jgi:hypothetical protein
MNGVIFQFVSLSSRRVIAGAQEVGKQEVGAADS